MKKETSTILKKELQEHAPGLAEFSTVNPFNVPEDYFANLPETIQNLKNKRTKLENSAVTGYSLRKVMIYTSALLLFLTVGLTLLLTNKDDSNGFTANYNDDAIYELYFSQLTVFNDALYYDMLLNEEEILTDINNSFSGLFDLSQTSDEDPYFEYLLDYMNKYNYSPEYFALLE